MTELAAPFSAWQACRKFLRHPRSEFVKWARPHVRPALQAVHRRRLSRKVDLAYLAARPPDSYPADFSDLWFLYATVRQLRPRLVLEFGSGASTAVLASAVHANNGDDPGSRGRVVSIDDQQIWADATWSTLPSFLREVCEVIHSPTIEVDHEGVKCLRHAVLPTVVPDFIYLDGPTFTRDRHVAVDILDLEASLPVGTVIVIDGRDQNTKFLKAHLTRRFKLKHRVWYDNAVLTISS